MTPLRQRMIEDMQLRGLAVKTQQVYIHTVKQLAEHYDKSPDRISEEELRQYFLHLKNVRQVSHSTFTVALYGIKFLYQQTLRRDWTTLELARPVREKKLPVVLSRAEVRRVLACIHRPHYRVCLSTIYACGLRVREGVFLQVQDIDSDRRQVHVRHAKGSKARYVPLPTSTLRILRQYWGRHRHPVWLFPSPSSGDKPMSVGGVQRCFKAALLGSGVQKAATVHTLRHSYGRPFGRLVNASLDATRHQGRVFLPWRLRVPSHSGLVSFQGTRASREGKADPQKANVQKGWNGLAGYWQR